MKIKAASRSGFPQRAFEMPREDRAPTLPDAREVLRAIRREYLSNLAPHTF